MASTGSGPRAVRLVFECAGREVRMLSSESVDVPAPLSDRLDGFDDHLGVWVEVRTWDGRALHRRVLAGALEETVEVFQPGPSLRRRRVGDSWGSFAVLVPDLVDADHLAFLSGAGSAARVEGATELARFPLGRRECVLTTEDGRRSRRFR
ncbi:MAG: hypothetical protein ABIQ18_28560 [Umezawaea sp.]